MSAPSYAPSDKTAMSDDEEKGVGRDHRRALSILPTIPSNRAGDASTPLSRQNHRTLERTNSIGLTGPRRVDSASRLKADFRTLSIQVTETTRRAQAAKGKKDVAADLATLEWHTISIEEACTRLGVSAEVGLDKDMAARRLSKYGKNVISPPPKNLAKRIFWYIFGGFGSLLVGGAAVCFISWKPLGEPNPQASNLALALVLLVVVTAQAGFNAWQDYTTGKVMSSITGLLPSEVLVCRDGNTFKLPASELVSGDIVKVTLGTKVPADVRLIQCSSDLKFDRSILTGESKAVAGTTSNTDPNFLESRNIALQGTLCVAGSGVGVCVGLGDNTVFGRIAKQASGERPLKTSLQVEIQRFVLIIATLAFSVATLIVILWAAWLRKDHPDFINVPNLLINLVSVAVAFIPEGLPICVTLSMTCIAASMKKKNILCKSLSTVESLGCVSVICSDKTGTLTQNRMAVSAVSLGHSSVSAQEARQAAAREGETGNVVRTLAAIAALNNDAQFESANTDEPVEHRKINGDATDTGLLRFAESVLPVTDLRSKWTEVAQLAFNSKNKYALKLFKLASLPSSSIPSLLESDNFGPPDRLLLVKGAPDVLLRRCSHYLDASGQALPLDEKSLDSIVAIQHELASKGQRVLLFAKKVVQPYKLEIEVVDDEDSLIALTTDLTIVGLAGLVDPLRDDTAETVRICRGAGIRFMMVTGDMSITAASIASAAGIISNSPANVKHIEDLPRDLALDQIPSYNAEKAEDDKMTSIVLSGSELITMTESQWKQVLAFDEVVFARTSPQQKLQIVKAYQGDGCTVAVTGDGVNDAPALKQADVGVAVAGGSEVAMEAADLILLDQFSAITVGVESGRLCFENLKKSILYLLPAGSFSELMPVLATIFFGLPQALSSIQMVLICAITDVPCALSLIFEKPEADLLLRKPRDRKKDRLADGRLLLHAYFFLGLIESITSLFVAFYFGFGRRGIHFSSLWLKFGDYGLDADVLAEATAHAQSIYFFNLVIMQWFNLLATRTRRLSIFQQPPLGSKRTSNPWLFPAMIAALIFAVFFSYIPGIQRAFGTRGIAVEFYFLPMAFGTAILLLDEGRKYLNRRHPSSLLARLAW